MPQNVFACGTILLMYTIFVHIVMHVLVYLVTMMKIGYDFNVYIDYDKKSNFLT